LANLFLRSADKHIQEVDDFTGPIIKRDFTLSAPDWIEVTVQGTKSDPTDIVTGHKVNDSSAPSINSSSSSNENDRPAGPTSSVV